MYFKIYFQIVTNYSGIIDYNLEQIFQKKSVHVFVQNFSGKYFPNFSGIFQKKCLLGYNTQ